MCKENCSYGQRCAFGSDIANSSVCDAGCKYPKETSIQGGICALSEIKLPAPSGEPGFWNVILPQIDSSKFFEAPIKNPYKDKMDFEKWYDKNESEIDIELAENGADREMDFDREREYEKRYDQYLLGSTVHEKAWAAWREDQMANLIDINAASYVKGYKAGYAANTGQYTGAEVLAIIRKFLADHPLHRGIQIMPMAVLRWFQDNKKK